VLGVVVDVGMLTEVLELDERARIGFDDALDELTEFLLPVADRRKRFANTLVRDVAYEGLPYRRRAELHARTAEAIERQGTAEADRQAELLSFHCLHGARYEAAWGYSKLAAEHARTIYANADAAELYGRALTAAGHVGAIAAAELASVNEALADTYFDLGETGPAELALKRAAKGADVAPADLARRRMKLAKLREVCGQYATALRWLSRARAAVAGDEDLESRRLVAQLTARQARIRYKLGRHRHALRLAKEVIAQDGAADPRSLAEALEIADWADQALGVTDAAARTERALEIYTELSDLAGEARMLNTLGAFAYFRGRWPVAVERYRAAAEAYIRAGRRWDAATPEANAAEILIDQGQLEEAEAALERSMRLWRAAGAAHEIAFGQYLLGRIAARTGRLEQAQQLFDHAREYLSGADEAAEVMLVDAFTAETLVICGDYIQAALLASAGIEQTSQPGAPSSIAPLLYRVHGIAMRGIGRMERADRSLRLSLSNARRLDARHEIVFTLRELLESDLASDADERTAWQAEYAALSGELGIAA
jgi:tetratricopeptide (TPR) repeat protein